MLHTGGQIIDQNNFAKLFNEHSFFYGNLLCRNEKL